MKKPGTKKPKDVILPSMRRVRLIFDEANPPTRLNVHKIVRKFSGGKPLWQFWK